MFAPRPDATLNDLRRIGERMLLILRWIVALLAILTIRSCLPVNVRF